ncbi:Hypothetical predicted protein [Podarcis lilfordi]|uniref:Uncharacterized protein n=1 Tax=Podarcis lilfordi TaxID=74358 RepID=A0AA35PCA2_9SAUR|nr:Hypothetical predicted protein [Podarcis lilfordi]
MVWIGSLWPVKNVTERNNTTLTSFPEKRVELEGNYLLTKQAKTTVPDILLKYFNFPRIRKK